MGGAPARRVSWLQPSLARRLLLAQLALLLMMWFVVVGMIIHDAAQGNAMLAEQPRHDMIAAVADQLADLPARQRQALAALDTFQRADTGVGRDGPWTLVMLVRQQGRLIYASPEVPLSLQGPAGGAVTRVQAGGFEWRVRSSRSPHGTDVTLAQRTDSLEIAIEFNSRGYMLLPLMVSLPLLAFPAWLSVRLALRPLRQVSEAIASRGPHDLSDLQAEVPHRELQPGLAALNGLLARLRAGAARERDFIANAAHELRTPLAALRVNIEAMRPHTSDPAQRELLNGTLSSVRRAARLVAQLLALSRSETLGGTPRPLMLNELAQDSLAALAPLAMRGGVELELDDGGPVRVMGERDALMSVIDNLIDNAIKYSPPGATVTVGVHAAGGQARLVVRDRGPGIPPALRGQVFERFYRAPHQHTPGSGLGLSIVQAVLASHGGAIVLDEAPGGGLLAAVTLPLAPFIDSSSGL